MSEHQRPPSGVFDYGYTFSPAEIVELGNRRQAWLEKGITGTHQPVKPEGCTCLSVPIDGIERLLVLIDSCLVHYPPANT